MIEQSQPSIAFIGIVLQLAAALLLGGLFLLLRRYARRRRYFAIWGWAWLALSVGIGAVAATYFIPSFSAGLIYQFAKLAYFALLVAGTASYATGAPVAPFLPVALVLAGAYAFISDYAAVDWRALVAWQAPVAALALIWCAVRLATLPPSRHGIGSRVAGVGFAAMATVWALYFPAFGSAAGTELLGYGTFATIVRYNSYIDVLFHMILGCGMIVLLMEDAKREVDDAHEELAVAHSELRRNALYDALTGTLNRRAFAEGVALESVKAQYGAVMMVDLDDLKSVNDLHGHSAGDSLLQHLAEAVRNELRPSDKLYRWGGDEFLLVLPGADASRAEARLRGILARAATLRVGADGQEVRLSVSMGSAGYTSSEELQAAIDRADSRMYEEKTRKKSVRDVAAASQV